MSKELDLDNLTPDEAKEVTLYGCGTGIVGLLLSPLSAYWQAYVLVQLYTWFLKPIQGFPDITIANAIGLPLLIGMLWSGFTYNKAEKKIKQASDLLANYIAYVWLGPLFTLFIGWVYHWFFFVR